MTAKWFIFFGVMLALLTGSGCSQPEHPSISLYRAIHSGDLDQVKRHIYWQSNLNEPGPDGQSPLHVSAAVGQLVLVRLLVENGADINQHNRQGHPPIFSALLNGRTQIADYLVKRGADWSPQQALLLQIEEGVADRDSLRFSIQQGADPNQPDEQGQTPLALAIHQGHLPTIKWLIALGADVNKPSRDQIPLAIAEQQNNRFIVDLLLQQGATR